MKKEERMSQSRKPATTKPTYEAKVMRCSRNLGTGLTSVQHTALMLLCTYRHRLHAVSERYSALPKSKKSEIREFFLNKASTMLVSARLPALAIRFFPVEQIEDDTQKALYINSLNDQIEVYLSSIDKKYGTMYCPTGCRRQKRAHTAEAVRL